MKTGSYIIHIFYANLKRFKATSHKCITLSSKYFQLYLVSMINKIKLKHTLKGNLEIKDEKV